MNLFSAQHRGAILGAALALAGCATTLDDARTLGLNGQHQQAMELLAPGVQRDPNDRQLRAAYLRERDLTITQWVKQADAAMRSGRLEVAAALLSRARSLNADDPRVVSLDAELERASRQAQWLDDARKALAEGRLGDAQGRVQQILAESPTHSAARSMQRTLRERTSPEAAPIALGPMYQKPVTLEFRDAPLRNVLEGLGRSNGVNFVFDKDVRGDARVSVYLKDVSIDEALRVILSTQQLERKLLNDRTVLIYPATQAKQREHQELVTRSFYLVNTDVKQAQTLVRGIAKTRDIFVDDRLNLLVIRDTPEVVRLVERLITSLDIPEPEVLLEVEVLEVASSRVDDLGLQWPTQVEYGVPGQTGSVQLSQRGSFRGSIANPAIVATLNETSGQSNVLANPRLRARNHEKAKIVIGEKLPVFTTTSTANVGVSASVSYLDVGLKLEVEPSVLLDDDVVMKVNLEVSTLIGKVLGPQGSVAYQIGTRQATTSLRLRDGETQVLAGLIRDEDSKSISGIPGLADLPIAGRLFGVHSDTRNKTEVVLLITPRVVRNVGLPDAAVNIAPAGVDANPGADSVRMRRSSQVAIPVNNAAGRTAEPATVAQPPAAAASDAQAPAGASAPAAAPSNANMVLTVATSGQADVGSTAAVTLRNSSSATVRGEVTFDSKLVEPARRADRGNSRVAFEMAPGHEQVVLLRVLPAAASQTVEFGVSVQSSSLADGTSVEVRVEGEARFTVNAQ